MATDGQCADDYQFKFPFLPGESCEDICSNNSGCMLGYYRINNTQWTFCIMTEFSSIFCTCAGVARFLLPSHTLASYKTGWVITFAGQTLDGYYSFMVTHAYQHIWTFVNGLFDYQTSQYVSWCNWRKLEPFKSTTNKKPPWWSSCIGRAIKEKQKFYSHYKFTCSDADYATYVLPKKKPS